MNGFHSSKWRGAAASAAAVDQLGRLGALSKRIPAASGVALPLLKLQRRHDVTRFYQVALPPCERGVTWSRFRSRLGMRRPQYWQVKSSRRYTLRRESRIVVFGMRP